MTNQTPPNPPTEEQLLEANKGLVIQIARRYHLMGGGDTDDLIQEGMLGLLAAVRTYRADKDSQFSTYAAMCVRNRIRSVLRGQMRDKNRANWDAEAWDAATEQDSGTGDPFDVYIGEEKTAELYKTLKQLLSPRQCLVILDYLEGFSYAEIALRTGLGEKAVDNALASAKRRLRDYYENQNKKDEKP